jgi:hypothetical protein
VTLTRQMRQQGRMNRLVIVRALRRHCENRNHVLIQEGNSHIHGCISGMDDKELWLCTGPGAEIPVPIEAIRGVADWDEPFSDRTGVVENFG